MRRAFGVVVAGVLLAGVAGCASSPAAQVTAVVPTTVTAGAVGDPPVGDPPVSAVPVPVVPVGSAQSFGYGMVATVTVHGIDRAVPASTYDSDKSLRTALDVEVCIDARDYETPGVSAAPWSLTDGTGARYLPVRATDPKLPSYAESSSMELVKVAPGECLRGWLMIDVPAGATVTGVRYGLDDGTLLRWSL